MGEAGNIKIPIEIFEEFSAGTGPLGLWARDPQTVAALRLEEESVPELVARVVVQGYAADLTDEEIENVGRDPFLVAHALAQPSQRVVVTTEHSAPSRQRANRKLPDVCAAMGVGCCNTFDLIQRLDFRA
jgi:hypothetical protein